MKFNEGEISNLLYDGGIYDENDELIWDVKSEKITDFDQEKNSVEKRIVIQNTKTNEKYVGEIGESPWIGQDEANAQVEWVKK